MGKSHSYKALIDGVNRAITDLLEVARFKEHFQIDTGLYVSRHTHWVAKNTWYESFRKTGECSVSTDQVIEAQEESHDIRHDWQTAKIVVDQRSGLLHLLSFVSLIVARQPPIILFGLAHLLI